MAEVRIMKWISLCGDRRKVQPGELGKLIPSTLKMEAICSSKTTSYSHKTSSSNPEDCHLHSYHHGNLKLLKGSH
jgi:hypothetical protein